MWSQRKTQGGERTRPLSRGGNPGMVRTQKQTAAPTERRDAPWVGKGEGGGSHSKKNETNPGLEVERVKGGDISKPRKKN